MSHSKEKRKKRAAPFLKFYKKLEQACDTYDDIMQWYDLVAEFSGLLNRYSDVIPVQKLQATIDQVNNLTDTSRFGIETACKILRRDLKSAIEDFAQERIESLIQEQYGTQAPQIASGISKTTLMVIGGGGGSAALAAGLVALSIIGQLDFAISSSPSSATIISGQSSQLTITVQHLSGNAEIVSLSCSTPSQLKCSMSPLNVRAGDSGSTLTITTSSGASTGTYTVTITGTYYASGGSTTTRSTSVQVTVQAPLQQFDFGIQAGNDSVSVIQGGTVSIPITVTIFEGSPKNVNLRCSTSSADISCLFDSFTVYPNLSRVVNLNLLTTQQTRPGQYSVTVTAESDNIIKQEFVTLFVEQQRPVPQPLMVQTDKSVYVYGHTIILTAKVPQAYIGSFINFKIFHDNKIIMEDKIEVDSEETSIFQKLIKVEGPEWDTVGEEYKIIAEYDSQTAEVTIYTSNFGAKIELDQKVYTWTDKIFITIIAPDHNHDINLIEEIGDADHKIMVATRGAKLENYKLVETGSDTGIFTGEVILTGFQEHDANGDGNTGDASGISSGHGPDDGFLAAGNDDGLTVSFEFREDETVVGSALIRWNIGEVQFLEASYPATGQGVLRVVDPDMNLNPEAVDNFEVDAWSDSDAGGIDLTVTETNEATGIFEGIIEFSVAEESSGHRLRVAEGDTIYAEYDDHTLPEPYSILDKHSVNATSFIWIG